MMLIGLLVLAQASSIPPTTPAQAPTPPQADQKLICHLETIGASRIPQRICHTKAEWADLERQTEQDIRDNVNRHTQGNNPE